MGLEGIRRQVERFPQDGLIALNGDEFGYSTLILAADFIGLSHIRQLSRRHPSIHQAANVVDIYTAPSPPDQCHVTSMVIE